MRVIVLLFASFVATSASAEKLTIDRIYGGGNLSGPTPTKVEISPDGSRVTFLRAKADDQTTYDLWEYNVNDRATRLLLDSKKLIPGEEKLTDAEKARRERARTAGRHGFVDYTWAPDGKKLLFPLNGKLYIYDLTAKSTTALRELATGGAVIDSKVSPRGRYVSYVRDQNLWVIDLSTGRTTQLTDDGGGAIHNGEAEFIAEEELDRFTGYWWAPDDSAIAYERFDESQVDLVKRFEIYADRSEVIEQRYPAAGKANVDVKVGVVAPTGGPTKWIDLGANHDIYLARADWLPDSQRLSYQLLQRNQKRLDLNVVDKTSLAPKTLITETSDTWINLNNDLHFLKDRDAFVWGSERSGFHHLYLYSLDGTLQHAISSGDWEIQDLLNVDEKNGVVYVDSNKDFVPDEQLYALRLDGSYAANPKRISQEDGMHAVKFGKDAKVYVDTFSDPSTPPQTSVHNSTDGKFLSWIEENKLDSHHPYWPYRDSHIVPEFGTIQAADGETLYYRLFKPLNFDAAKRYPVFDTYYGGPHGRVVSRGWVDYFSEFMAQHDYVAFSLDNRGMADRGRKFSDGIYKQFGKLEVEDQVAGFHWLKAQPWVDPQRIGIFGWSYGGYMTAMLLAKASNEVAGGVAVAPVIDWTLYDTAYTERYLDTPQNNAQGYELSSVLHWLDGLTAPFLLIHGMADDNVQFTNSTKLMAALQERGVHFDLMTYPGGKHGLSTPAMRKHAFHEIADFFDEHVKKEKVENAAK